MSKTDDSGKDEEAYLGGWTQKLGFPIFKIRVVIPCYKHVWAALRE